MPTEAKLKRSSARTSTDVELSEWITSSAPRVLGYALTLIPNRTAAEDIVQDCYHRLLVKSAHGEYDLPRDGTKLLFKAVTNACINWTQRTQPVVSFDASGGDETYIEQIHDRRNDPSELAMLGEFESAVADALAELPVNQRAVVELQALGHTSVDIAEMLDITPENARVLLHRARRKLAEKLQPFLEERQK